MAAPLKGIKVQMYVLDKKYPQAIAQAKKLLVRSPQSYSTRLLLIDATTKSKATDKAHALLDKWIAEYRKNSNNNQIDRLGRKLTPKQMIAEFQGLKASVYVDADEFDKAKAYVSDCTKKDPKNYNVRATFIGALMRAKEYDRAMVSLDVWIKALAASAAMQPKPKRPPAAWSFDNFISPRWSKETAVRILVMKKDYDKAIGRANEYLKQYPENLDLLRLRSSALNEIGQPAKALEDMRKMYKLQPDFSGHWNNLGYQLADMGIELTKAEGLIRRSLAATVPSSVTYVPPLDSLAWSLYKQGKLHAAGKVFLDVIRRSAEHKYSHPILFDHAGDGFYRLGWTDKAVGLWTQAVKLAGEDETGSREVSYVKRDTPGKIKAVKAGKPAKVAPLGKGVKIEEK